MNNRLLRASVLRLGLAAAPALALALSLSGPVRAASDLAVLPQGAYACWTPGAATGPAVTDVPGRGFTIVRGSGYASASGGGTYLLAGGLLTFTRGPFKDLRLRRTRDGYWQQIARDGEPERLRCSRLGSAPPPAPAISAAARSGADTG